MHVVRLSRLKQPEYQYFREIIGAAKTFEQLEKSTSEIKTLLLVRIVCVHICVMFNGGGEQAHSATVHILHCYLSLNSLLFIPSSRLHYLPDPRSLIHFYSLSLSLSLSFPCLSTILFTADNVCSG